MKSILKIVVIFVFVTFAAMQLFRPDRTNPPVVEAETLERSLDVPENVGRILSRSCTDCHSNATVYPWYSHVAPISWLLVGHIEDGRRELNFSVWNTYDPDRRRRKLDEICREVESGAMPLPSYLWIHRDAALAPDDVRTLCDWTEREMEKIVEHD